ncbi:MAG: prolipoprotein diacylglyceryl transferase [Gemmatimonadales bacterium]
MFPTLFRIGHFSISTYGVVVAVAFFVAGWVVARGFRERKLSGDDAWSLVIYGLFGGFAGAKLYYVLLHGDFGALLARGGFVWYGGLVGGAVAVAVGITLKRLPLGAVADAIAPGLAIGHAIGHVACFFSGDSYGVPSNLPWAVAFPRGAPPSTAGVLRSEFGVSLPSDIPDTALVTVHPTMLYSALALLAAFGVLWWLRRRQGPAGWLFGLYLVFSGVERFLVEFVRAKDDRLLWGYTTAQAFAVAAVALGATLLVMLHMRARRTTSPMTAGAH